MIEKRNYTQKRLNITSMVAIGALVIGVVLIEVRLAVI